MKSLMTLWLLAAITHSTPLERRQFGSGSSTSNELQSGSCGDVIFIFARGSTERGNMWSERVYGSAKAICQGVGGGYTADLGSNALPAGMSAAGVREAADMFAVAARQCPDASIVAAGYSQDAALIASAISTLYSSTSPSSAAQTQAQIQAVVLYGYTKNQQNNGKIPNYPADQTKVFRNASDAVCRASLTITAGHLAYTADVDEAVDFLVEVIGRDGGTGTGATGTAATGADAVAGGTTSSSSGTTSGFGGGFRSFGGFFSNFVK